MGYPINSGKLLQNFRVKKVCCAQKCSFTQDICFENYLLLLSNFDYGSKQKNEQPDIETLHVALLNILRHSRVVKSTMSGRSGQN